jgi:hypothetical protein
MNMHRTAVPSGRYPRTEWFKSSYSNGSCTCVEARFDGGIVHIRNSRYLLDPGNDPVSQPTIAVSANDWPTVVAEMVGDLPAGLNRAVDVHTDVDGAVTVRSRTTGVALAYDADEIAAFRAGVNAGEFSTESARELVTSGGSLADREPATAGPRPDH